MAITKDHAIVAGVIAAVAMGGASLMRSAPSAPASMPAPSASIASPPPPSKCQQACGSIASWCSMGRSVTCVAAMQAREAESADGGAHFSCSEPLTQQVLDRFGWCPNHGEEKPMKVGP